MSDNEELEESVVPVYVKALSAEEQASIAAQIEDHLPPDEIISAQLEARASGVAKLMKLGLTEEEARAISGS